MAGNKGIVSAQFYTFSAANRTITFTNDYAGLDLGEITYITNIKNGVATVIYDPFDATKGGTLSGLTLTLAYDTTLMANTDPLQIITGFTPLNADPTPVRIVEGPDEKDDTDLLNRIADSVDFLNLALDQSEGIQMNVREINSYKKDIENALVLSDTIEIKYAIPANANPFSSIIDTKGYQQIQWAAYAGQSWAVQNVQFSNDQQNWANVGFLAQAGSGTPQYVANSLGSSGACVFTTAVQGRYFRLQYWNQNSVILNFSIILRNAPLSLVGAGINITGVNSNTPPAAAGLNSTNSLQSVAGTFQVSGQLSPTQNPPNAVQTLQTTVPNPMGIGGREQPYIGVLAGVFRYLNVDGRGYLQIGGDTAFRTPNMGGALEQSSAGTTRGIGGVLNNIQGAQSLTVADTNQNEGDTDNMLLKQILTELKILNQQFAELPTMINLPSYELSDPQEYRDDRTFQ